MSRRIGTVLAGIVIAAVGNAAAAQEIKLVFATTNQPAAHVNVKFMHPYAKRLNEKGKGVLAVEVVDGMAVANFTNYYDRVVNDVVQISWGVQSYLGAQFEKSSVVGLPYAADDAVQASAAYWRLYESGLLDSEYTEIVPLFLNAFVHSSVHWAKQPTTLDNWNGLKMFIGSRIHADITSRLGGAPITLPLTDSYTALQRGTVDAIVTAWTAFQPFKLAEVTRYHVDTRLGSGTGVTFMAKKRYNALPAAARKIIDEERGERLSRAFGQFWEDVNTEGRQTTLADPAHTLLKLSDAQAAAWRAHAEAVAANWAKGIPDGERLVATYKELLAKVKAGG
jgi:TRAP-type C4-dicarboxylate transport system substrate-binding protein